MIVAYFEIFIPVLHSKNLRHASKLPITRQTYGTRNASENQNSRIIETLSHVILDYTTVKLLLNNCKRR